MLQNFYCILRWNVLEPGYTMLYSNCTIYSNIFHLTRNHILQGMTVSNIQLLIGVYDSGKKFANFDRNIKYIIDNAK